MASAPRSGSHHNTPSTLRPPGTINRTAIHTGSSPRQIAATVGVPLEDLYRTLVRFARDGIVEPHCSANEFDELLELGLIDESGPVAPRMADPEGPQDVAAAMDDAWDRISGQ